MPVRAPLLSCLLLLGHFAGPSRTPPAAPGDEHEEGTEPETTGNSGKKSTMRRVLQVLGIVFLGMVLVVVSLMLMEKALIFYPEKDPLGGTWQPSGMPVEHVQFTTSDGLKLHAWWRLAETEKPPEERPVLIYCHGNGGNLTRPVDRMELLNILANAEVNVLLFDYRGYGASEGSPDEDGLYVDGEAAYDYLVEERGIDPCRIFVYGRSLGASVALHIALNRDVQGVVLDGAYASVPHMAALHPLLRPLTFLIRNRFNNIAKAEQLEDPLLVIHGAQDEIVPVSQARAIRDAAVNAESRSFWKVRSAHHNDTFFVAPNQYKTRLRLFCEKYMECEE
jgi:hypothetical protein